MSYTPTEWESTDVVTATRINALETAVGDMNMSYTPNTWSDGDILSAEKMNALEQAVASGGGGSSDFSTATMTVSGFPTGLSGGIGLSLIWIDDEYLSPADRVNFQNGDYEVVMYKGEGFVLVNAESGWTISGNASADGIEILYTGDFTISAV